MKQGVIHLSSNYTREDWKKLHLTRQSDFNTWKKAIKIFDDRIMGWYFNSIDLLSDNVFKNGFSIMAICCLLIDTFKQFMDGELTSNPNYKNRGNESKYEFFLQHELNDVFDNYSARVFYKSIRCGILHSAQTKNDAILVDIGDRVVQNVNGMLQVAVVPFVQRLKEYYTLYKNRLLDEKELVLRNSFIKKMNDIVNK